MLYDALDPDRSTLQTSTQGRWAASIHPLTSGTTWAVSVTRGAARGRLTAPRDQADNLNQQGRRWLVLRPGQP
jgi:hypothetical protein